MTKPLEFLEEIYDEFMEYANDYWLYAVIGGVVIWILFLWIIIFR